MTPARPIVTASMTEAGDAMLQQLLQHELASLSIVDAAGRPVGIISRAHALASQAHAGAAPHRASHALIIDAAVGGNLPRQLPNVSVWTQYRARIAWLLVLVFGNLFSGAGIAAFEETIAAYIALVFFMPLLIDSGGNAGSQAATLMVRALATGDARLADWARMLRRECGTSLLLGASMAGAVALIALWRSGPDIALVVSLSMVLIVVIASCIGLLVPLLLHRFKLDPAVASAPLITSIADALGVVIYFALATWLLPPLTA